MPHEKASAELGIHQHDAETILKKLDEIETAAAAAGQWEVVAMRGSLRGVRSRVERIAGQVVRDGCRVCREDEAQGRFPWVNDRDEEPQLKKTCAACGRTYELQSTWLSWMAHHPQV